MKVRINKAHFPVSVLGPGRRLGIWFQGCSIRCAGCVSRDTWESDPALGVDISSLFGWCKQITGGELDGVTISGGEPFDQPQGLRRILDLFLEWRETAALGFDMLCYSGYRYHHLRRCFPDILMKLDALIPEPYQARRPQTRRWRGSSNQPIVALSALGRERYALTPQEDQADHRFQFCVDDERIWFIGIPERGHMQRLAKLCEKEGLVIEAASWRA